MWTIRLDKRVARALMKLDKPVARRISAKLREISELDNPRDMGKALTGDLAGYWRYRVGDYRIICEIFDKELLILAVKVGHRGEIYGS